MGVPTMIRDAIACRLAVARVPASLREQMAPELGSSAVDSGSRSYWLRQVRATQWRLNAGWWFEALQPVLFAAALGFTALVLAGRRAGWDEATYAVGLCVLVVAAFAGAFWRARPRFVSLDNARAELESRLALHTRLSAAQAGIGPWPPRPEVGRNVWRWSWKRLAAVPAISLFLGIAAWQIPIPEAEGSKTVPVVKPPALAAVEKWIEHLEENPALDQSSLEEVKEQAEQLAEQEPASWYTHASLEAADHLQQQMQGGLQSLDQNAAVMQTLIGSEQQLSQRDAERWNEQMQGALGELSGNVPSLNRALAEQLRQLDGSKLRSLTPDQLQKLQQQLAQARGAAKELLDGNGLEDGEGEDEEEGGRGGVNRGPGHAPLKYGSAPTDLETTKTEGLESEDFSHASLGDLGGMSDGQHQVDKNRSQRAESGGTVKNAGAGPDAVWLQQALPPEERRRLRDFYQ